MPSGVPGCFTQRHRAASPQVVRDAEQPRRFVLCFYKVSEYVSSFQTSSADPLCTQQSTLTVDLRSESATQTEPRALNIHPREQDWSGD